MDSRSPPRRPCVRRLRPRLFSVGGVRGDAPNTHTFLFLLVVLLRSAPWPISWDGASAFVSAAKNLEALPNSGPSVCFVGLPLEGHVEPLLFLAAELAARGYRTSLAVPEGPFAAWARAWVSARSLPGLSILALELPQVPPAVPATESPPQSWWRTLLAPLANRLAPSGLGWGSFAAMRREMSRYLTLERLMFAPLLEVWRHDRPTLVVADRYAFAAFDACEALGLRYVLGNNGPLMDLDGTVTSAAAAVAAAAGPLAGAAPPPLVPAPLSGLGKADSTLWDRCRGRFFRVLRALSVRETVRSVDAFRQSQGLPEAAAIEPSGRWGMPAARAALVLTATVFGLEMARAMPPASVLVGPIWPPPPPPPLPSSPSGSPQQPLWEQRDSVVFGVFAAADAEDKALASTVPENVRRWLDQRPEAAVVVLHLCRRNLGEPLAPGAASAAEEAAWWGLRQAGMRVLWLRSSVAKAGPLAGSSRGGGSSLDSDVFELAVGTGSSPELLLALMSQPSVTTLATGGELWAAQSALWHGCPVLCAPASPHELEGASLLAAAGVGVRVGDAVAAEASSTTAAADDSQAWTAAMQAAKVADCWGAASQLAPVLRSGGGRRRAGDMLEAELALAVVDQAAAAAAAAAGAQSCEGGVPFGCCSKDDRVCSLSGGAGGGLGDLGWGGGGGGGSGGLAGGARRGWEPGQDVWWRVLQLDAYAVFAAGVLSTGALLGIGWRTLTACCGLRGSSASAGAAVPLGSSAAGGAKEVAHLPVHPQNGKGKENGASHVGNGVSPPAAAPAVAANGSSAKPL